MHVFFTATEALFKLYFYVILFRIDSLLDNDMGSSPTTTKCWVPLLVTLNS